MNIEQMKLAFTKKGYGDASELFDDIGRNKDILKPIQTILNQFVKESTLPDDIHILYIQLNALTTFHKKWETILLRDTETIFKEVISPSDDTSVIYFSDAEAKEVVQIYAEAMKGESDSQLELGKFYKSIQRDEWAFPWYKAAAQAGNPDAYYWLGNYYFDGVVVERDLEKTYHYYKKAASMGHPDALNNYADMYLRGEYVEKNTKHALELFKMAADKGVPEAMYTLGYMYENGVGTEVDSEESRYWFTQSALSGDVFAANRLGHEAVEKGEGTEAIHWYTMAAEKHDPYGEFNLGLCYENGIGTPINLKKAKYWYQKSALKGDEQAKERLKHL
jgi:uncharacterized protein